MPQVIIEQPGVVPMTVPLSGEVVQFGRAEDNDVVLTAEEVSRHHAIMYGRGGKIFLQDQKSLNGTYVNRQRIVERVLAHRDEIWFGSKCRLVFRDDTCFGRETVESDADSKLIRDMDKIRAEMDRVGNSLTMMAKHGRTPVVTAGRPTPPPQATPDDLLAMSRAYRRLAALYGASKLMASEFDLPRRLSYMLDTALEELAADRGFVLIKDEKADKLRVSVAREMGQDLAASSPSMGIAGKAAIDGEPVLMTDPASDQEFGTRESIIRQHITSAMAVPLKVEDRLIGSIYIDTRKQGIVFNEEDLELFASLAAQCALAIENVRLHETTVNAEKKRLTLARFLSPAILDEVLREGTSLELGGTKRVVTTMFCDIRGFTKMSESMTPEVVVAVLNEHFSAMTDIIFRYNGTLDKFIGDEIMAVFGAPIFADDDAVRAVKVALLIMAKNVELNRQREMEHRPMLQLGIGINTGEVVAGYIGAPAKMEFTVVGDHVNVARRLCDLAKGGQIIAGGSTMEAAGGYAEGRLMGDVVLEGKANPVETYEVLRLLPVGQSAPNSVF
jgi:adenylate cyclase